MIPRTLQILPGFSALPARERRGFLPGPSGTLPCWVPRRSLRSAAPGSARCPARQLPQRTAHTAIPNREAARSGGLPCTGSSAPIRMDRLNGIGRSIFKSNYIIPFGKKKITIFKKEKDHNLQK